MISRAQGKTWTAGVAVAKQQKLSALEKAMLKWAVVDPEDRLLDASISSGMMAEYLGPYLPRLRHLVAEADPFCNDADYLSLGHFSGKGPLLGSALYFVKNFLESNI